MQCIELEAFPVESFGAEPMPSVAIEGAAGELIRATLRRPPAILTGPEPGYDTPLPFQANLQSAANFGEHGVRIWQASPYHKRSFIVDHPDFADGITDEFGTTYPTISIKGNNFSRPGVMQSGTASEGFIPWGLQEGNVIERVHRASKMLRSLGVGTEFIIGLSEPEMIPLANAGQGIGQHELIGRNAYKQTLINQFMDAQDEPSLETLVQLQDALAQTGFFVFMRAQDSPYRMSDFLGYHELEQTERDQLRGTILQEHGYDVGYEYELMKEVFAPNAARNLAIMHSAGLVHAFLHPGNITPLGSLVDLDSVRGEPLGIGDEPIIATDAAIDVGMVLTSMPAIYNTSIYDILSLDQTERTGPINILLRTYLDELEQRGGIPGVDTADVIHALVGELGWEEDVDHGPYTHTTSLARSELQHRLDRLGKPNIDQITPEFDELFTARADQILDEAVSLIEESTEFIFSQFGNEMIWENQTTQLVMNGQLTEALDHYADVIDSVFQAIKDLVRAGMSIVAMKELPDHPSYEDLLNDGEKRRTYFDEHADAITERLMNERWEEVRGHLMWGLERAVAPQTALHPDAQPLYVTEKNHFHYEVQEEYDWLRELVLDPDRETRIIPIDTLEPDDTMADLPVYESPAEERCWQYVVFHEMERGTPLNEQKKDSKAERFGIDIDRMGAIVMTVEQADGSIRHDVIVRSEEMVSPDALKDADSFWAARTAKVNPTRLFEVDDIPVVIPLELPIQLRR